MFDPVGGTLGALPLMKKDGLIISISTMPSGSLMKKSYPGIPVWLVYLLNFMAFFFEKWVNWKDVKYDYMFMESKTKDLDRLAKWVNEGKIKPIVGRQTKLSDILEVRKGCQEVLDGKGGIGKFVIDID
jgi:NADPH:quinone reductase-like Zn-dependent oxidoreductase